MSALTYIRPAWIKPAWDLMAKPLTAHVQSDDELALLANTGSTIVWTHLPFYPLLVWWIAGRPIWSACVILATTPLFFAVPRIARRDPTAGRAAFVVFGVANTLLSIKAYGARSDVGWFLLPCLLIAATFFRPGEWKVSAALSLPTATSALLIRHLWPPLHVYSPAQYAELQVLNHWCVGCLAAYLVAVVARAHLRTMVRG